MIDDTIRLAQQHDEAAMAAVYAEHRRDVRAACAHRLRKRFRNWLDDVEQEAWLRADWLHGYAPQQGSSIGAWLAAIGSRTAIDFLRRASVSRRGAAGFAQRECPVEGDAAAAAAYALMADPCPSSFARVLHGELSHAVRTRAARLHGLKGKVVRGLYLRELRGAELARTLGISEARLWCLRREGLATLQHGRRSATLRLWLAA